MKENRQKSGISLKKYPQFKRIALHRKPHADEILAWMMLQTKAGREIFPNLDINNVVWISDNNWSYRDNPDVLPVGCGKHPLFDEHADPKNDWEASCTLMARALGLLNHPWWRKTIEDVRREDCRGRAIKGEIAWMIKSLYRSHGGDVEADMQIVRWAEIAYWAEIESAKTQDISREKTLTTKTARALLEKQNSPDLEWWLQLARETREIEEFRRARAKEDFLKLTKCYVFSSALHGQVKLFVVENENDNEELTSVCWSFGADILVIRKKSGLTAVQTSHRFRKDGENTLDMTEVQKEFVRLEPTIGATWVLAGEKGMVLNGSSAYSDVIPSGLSLNKIAIIIQEVLGDNGFTQFAVSYDVLEKTLDAYCK